MLGQLPDIHRIMRRQLMPFGKHRDELIRHQMQSFEVQPGKGDDTEVDDALDQLLLDIPIVALEHDHFDARIALGESVDQRRQQTD